MIYDQLVRVNQIDNEIRELHEHLGKLYQERQQIVAPAKTDKTPKPKLRLQWQKKVKTNA